MNISVVIPTFNRATTLPRAIDSVLLQLSPAHEIIVIDDGSTDNTQSLLDSYGKKIRVLTQQNHGVSHARNSGIQAATGDWIALLDSDDEWHQEKLKVQSAELQTKPQYRITHCDELWFRKGRRVNPMNKHQKKGGSIYQECLPLCAISPSAVLIQKSVFDTFGFFDETLPACEDYDLWLRLCSELPVHYIDKALLNKYGGHADQLSARHWGMDRFRMQALDKILTHGDLSSVDHHATVDCLKNKLFVYANGAKKRGRFKESDWLEKRYAPHLSPASSSTDAV